MPVKYGRAVASGARYSAMVLTPAQWPAGYDCSRSCLAAHRVQQAPMTATIRVVLFDMDWTCMWLMRQRVRRSWRWAA